MTTSDSFVMSRFFADDEKSAKISKKSKETVDSDSDEGVKDRGHQGMSDFDIMLAKKKAENRFAYTDNLSVRSSGSQTVSTHRPLIKLCVLFVPKSQWSLLGLGKNQVLGLESSIPVPLVAS